MTELEKADAGIEYYFLDDGVAARKENAYRLCKKFNAIDPSDIAAQNVVIKELFGSIGEMVYMQPGFNCDYGKNIYVGEDFLTNYNVTILDCAPVHIGDYCLIGPNSLISAVGHPMSPEGRRKKMAVSSPVTIGDNVWIGANCTILPGVTIGNNVIVAAGAVVTKAVPDNCVVAGVPAKVIQELKEGLK